MKSRNNPDDAADRSEDPITGATGAHPIGSAGGAAAGAAYRYGI